MLCTRNQPVCAVLSAEAHIHLSHNPVESNTLLPHHLPHWSGIRIVIGGIGLGPIILHSVLMLLATGWVHRTPTRTLWNLVDPTGRLQQRVLTGRLAHHPGMIERLLGRISSPGINVQQFRQQILGRRGQILGPAGKSQLKFRLDHGIRRDHLRIIVEGQTSAQQDKNNHTQRPRIDRPGILLPLQHFRGQISTRSEKALGHRFRHYLLR